MKKKLFAAALFLVILFCSCMPHGLQIISETSEDSITAIDTPQITKSDIFSGTTLTGLRNDNDGSCNSHIAAVVVDNLLISWHNPQSGLSEASILYEILMTDGDVTRFLAFYEDYNTMPVVGPVRDPYDQMIQLVLPLKAFLVTDWLNQNTADFIKKYDFETKVMTAQYGRDTLWVNGKRVEHMAREFTRYTDGGNLSAAVQYYEVEDECSYSDKLFDFISPDDVPRVLPDGAATSVSVYHSERNMTHLDFDAKTSQYKLSQEWIWGNDYEIANDYKILIDNNDGKQLAFDNVFVLFAEMQTIPNQDSNTYFEGNRMMEILYSCGGIGYYFNGGYYEKIRWIKETPTDMLKIVSIQDGFEAVKINPGTSYVAIVDNKMESGFSFK